MFLNLSKPHCDRMLLEHKWLYGTFPLEKLLWNLPFLHNFYLSRKGGKWVNSSPEGYIEMHAWIVTGGQTAAPPPILNNPLLGNMKDNLWPLLTRYGGFQDYVQLMIPLFLHERWECVSSLSTWIRYCLFCLQSSHGTYSFQILDIQGQLANSHNSIINHIG